MKALISTSLSLFLILTAHGQEECPAKKDTVTPGLLETLFPVNKDLISYKTYYVDKKYKVTNKPKKYAYKFMVPEYNNTGAKFFDVKLGKSLDHCPMISSVNDSLLHGELIYHANGSYYHLSFNNGVLWSISEEVAINERWKSYTDLSPLFQENPKWIRKEHYDLDGNAKYTSYWFYCNDQITVKKWENCF